MDHHSRKGTIRHLAAIGTVLVALAALQFAFTNPHVTFSHEIQSLALPGYLLLVAVAARYFTTTEAVITAAIAATIYSAAYLPHFLALPEGAHKSYVELGGRALLLLGTGFVLAGFKSGLAREKDRAVSAERERSARIRALRDISATISSSLNLDSVLDALAKQMVDAVGATFCRMLLLEDDGSTVRVAAVQPVRKIDGSIGPGATERLDLLPHYREAVTRQEAVIVNGGGSEDEAAAGPAEQRLMSGAKTMLIHPLVVGGTCVGLVCLGEHRAWERSPMGDEKAALCQTIANAGALTVSHALAHDRLKEAFMGTISSLAEAIDAKDAYTRGHSNRVASCAVTVGREMGLSEEQLDALECAGRLHDVGKIGIADVVLGKSDSLTGAEWWQMRKHPEMSVRIIEPAHFSATVMAAIRYHHERYDGEGYPRGLAGESIPVEARILAVVDSFEAMTSDRPYRRALVADEALAELRRCAGTQFDPAVVAAFLKAMDAGPSFREELQAG